MPSFSIELINSTGVIVFVLLLFISMALFRLRYAQASLGFSASNSNQAQGIFIAMVIIHHIEQRLSNHAIDNFLNYGYLAVGVFFFLSGYGLIKSINKNEAYLKGFILKKTVAIIFPFIFVNFLSSVVLYLSSEQGLTDFLLFATSLKLIDTTSWFVISIFIFYMAFYVFFNWFSQGKALAFLFVFTALYIAVSRYMGFGDWVYKSSLCFPIGALLGVREYCLDFWLKKLRFFGAGIIGACFFILMVLAYPGKYHFLVESVICVCFSLGAYLVLSVIELHSPLSKIMGRLSLDSYLIHMKLMLIFSYFSALHSFLWLTLYFVLLVLLSQLFNMLHNKLGSTLLAYIAHKV